MRMNYLRCAFLLAMLLAPVLQLPVHAKSATIPFSDSPRACGAAIAWQRQQEIAANTRLIHPDLSTSLSKFNEAEAEVGDTLSFYTINYKLSVYETIQAVCLFKSDLSYIFVSTEALADGRVSTDAIDNFYQSFEIKTSSASINPNMGIREIINHYIGPTPSTFGDSRLYILIHDIIDNFDPATGNYTYVAGYFSQSDLTSDSYSNKKNLIHVDCNPLNPAGDDALATVAHEFQHLIHYSFDPDENTTGLWVNESCSEYCEVLCGFPLRNPNGYLQHPERSLTVFDSFANELLDYKKVALWSYYLGEKFGPELIGEIVRDPKNGVEGVRSALVKRGIALSFEDIFANFVIANYADDPSLDATGYLGYQKIALPVVPPATQHRVYPVSQQTKTISQYAAFYSRFLSPDSTAILQIGHQPTDEVRDRILYRGAAAKVEDVTLDANKKGSYSLRAIGRSADELVLATVSMGTVGVCSYSVTSEFQDIYPPSFLSGPVEFLPTGNSVTIIWDTDEPASSIIEYGPTSELGVAVRDTNYVTQHRQSLAQLKPNTVYYYRVGGADARGNGPSFSAVFNFTTSDVAITRVADLQQKHAYGYWGRSLARDREGILHLLFHEIVGDRRYVYHVRSTDQGITWSAPQAIDATLNYAGMPSVALDSLGRLHATWHAKEFSDSKYGIYYSRSDDGGLSWSSPVLVSKSVYENDQLYASVAVDYLNNPHIVWNTALYSTENTGDVYYARSVDGGVTWQNDALISNSTEHRCFVPTIDFTSKGLVYVLWVDGVFEQQTRKVYGTSSSDYQNWQPPAAITRSGVLYDTVVSFVIDPQDRLHMVYCDNYTPGDIRVMYTRLEGGTWSEPAPVAKSLSGNVDGAHISCDNAGDLYLLYRDDLGTIALSKNIAGPPRDDEIRGLRKQVVGQTGDIFFSMYHAGGWSATANLSNDVDDDAFPEMPRRLQTGYLDAIWMRVLTTTLNRLCFLHLDVTPPASTQPPKVVLVYPAAGAENVPYLRQAFTIYADFDQRLIADSLTSATVSVSSQLQGAVAGLIAWESSKRRMRFTANASLSPEDFITVRLSGLLVSDAGIGLDGNGNGIAEGTPADDYVWSFRTQEPDVSPPLFTIGILQNPVLSRYLDIYVLPSEMLTSAPNVAINGEGLLTQLVQGQSPMYKAGYRLDQNGLLHIEVNGTDLSGNSGSANRDFTAQLMMAESGGEMRSADGLLKLDLPAKSLISDTYLTIVTEDRDAEAQGILMAYQVGPSSLGLQSTAEVAFDGQPRAGQELVFQQKNSAGQWLPLATRQDGARWKAQLHQLGSIRVVESGMVLPKTFTLRQNYPNPFSVRMEQTTLVFELPEPAAIELNIYNLLGQRIRRLVDQALPAGVHTFRWDGRDEDHNRMASGVYFYQCKAGSQTLTRKLLLLE